MTYAVPGGPETRQRPSTVSAAGYLFILAAVLWIVTAILPLASINKVADAARSAFANCTNPKPDSVANLIKGFTIGATIVFIIIAIGAIILGTFVLRGSRAARIITWVAAGLGVILQGCQGISAGLSGSFSGFNTNSSGSCVDNKALQDQIKAAQPSYLRPISVTLAIIMLLLLIVVIILLALPASHPYFRKGGPAAAGVPGVADPAYPAYPPYPGGPSQPGAPPAAPPTPPAPPTDQPPPA